MRAPRSLRVGQWSGAAECVADRRGRARGLSPCFRIGRIDRPRAPKGLWFTVSEAEMHELISNRVASGEIWTARRAWDAEVSGDESGRALSRPTLGVGVRSKLGGPMRATPSARRSLGPPVVYGSDRPRPIASSTSPRIQADRSGKERGGRGRRRRPTVGLQTHPTTWAKLRSEGTSPQTP